MTDSTTRIYMLVEIQGQKQLACRVNGSWEMDSTCKSINEMLSNGLINTRVVEGWIQQQPVH